jgi:excisionase family DNA binding protein
MTVVANEHNKLTVQEVAALFRVSYMTIYRLIQSGELRAIRVGHSFRVPREAIDEYVDTHPGSTASTAA